MNQKVLHIKGLSIRMGKEMDMEYVSIQMALFMKVVGKMALKVGLDK